MKCTCSFLYPLLIYWPKSGNTNSPYSSPINTPYYINIYNEDFREKAQDIDLFSSKVFEKDYSGPNGTYSDLVKILNENTNLVDIIETVAGEIGEIKPQEKIITLIKKWAKKN